MTESQRIARLYEELYDGDSWIDVNFRETIKNIDAKTASKNFGSCNSIWQLVVHLTRWREIIMKRVHDEDAPSPDHNYLLPLTDKSESAWKQALVEYDNSQKLWLDYLSKIKDEALDKVHASGNTHYRFIHGLIQHDAYHLGQIVLIAKILRENINS